MEGPFYHTDNEEKLHCYVTAHGAATDRRLVITVLVMTDKTDIIRHRDRNVESRQQDQPVPQGLGDAVVQQDETGLLHSGHLVLR